MIENTQHTETDDTDDHTDELTVACVACGEQFSGEAKFGDGNLPAPIGHLRCPDCRPKTTEEK